MILVSITGVTGDSTTCRRCGQAIARGGRAARVIPPSLICLPCLLAELAPYYDITPFLTEPPDSKEH
jgi:hypothetical protein